jgi:metacaspase-1
MAIRILEYVQLISCLSSFLMKYRNCFLLIICLFIFFAINGQVRGVHTEGRKHGLIIAIGEYEASTGWKVINAGNDVPLIKGALEHIGFLDSDIVVLSDNQADKVGILGALDQLISKVRLGDMVVVHISSHGQQISDDNDDEVDGLDEAIVAFGAPVDQRSYAVRGGQGAYDGRYHLRDEELGWKIHELRRAVGSDGHVLVSIDACHSGTGARGTAAVRGGAAPFLLSQTKANVPVKGENGGFGLHGEGGTTGEGLGKFVLFSGSAAHELNHETFDENGNGVGSLSYCLSKALTSMPERSTYRALFARVRAEMAGSAPGQTPQLEGDVDFELFNGAYRVQDKYHPVHFINDARTLIVKGGRLMNLREGTVIAIERAGAHSPSAQPLATGMITSARNFLATATLDQDIALKNAQEVWVFVTRAVVPPIRVKVALEEGIDVRVHDVLIKSLSTGEMVELVDKQADLIIKPAQEGIQAYSIQVVNAAHGVPLHDKPLQAQNTNDLAKQCAEVIQNFGQGRLLRELDVHDASVDVVINRILPVKAGYRDPGNIVDPALFTDPGNIINIPAGTYIYLEMQNRGTRTAFYNILDIEPSGRINPLLPAIRQGISDPPVAELKLNPGETRIIRFPVKIAPPYGNEVFKVISSHVSFDIASTIVLPDFRARANTIPVQKLLGDVFNGMAVRGELDQRESGTSTSEFVFRIVPAR